MATIDQIKETIRDIKKMSKEEINDQIDQIHKDGEDYFHRSFVDFQHLIDSKKEKQ